jgi:glycosyltransferase involved in cell wall biosynthesis
MPSRAEVDLISFIIPAYNEERLLGATLRAIHTAAKAIGVDYEVIVADDASSDSTAAIAREQGAKVVSVAHRQIAATRNSGARAATGDVFLFVDADTLVNEAVVAGALRAVRRGAVGGGATVHFDGRVPLWGRVLMAPLNHILHLFKLAAGCFVFCTRQAFERTGGFDQALYASEEITFSKVLKRHGKFVVLRQAVVTSGRKLRDYSGWEMLRFLFRIAVRGPNAVRSREGLEIWYEERRPGPESSRTA